MGIHGFGPSFDASRVSRFGGEEAPPPRALAAREARSWGARRAAAFWPALTLAPLGVGLLATRGRRGVPVGLASAFGVATGLGLVRWQLARWFVDTPRPIVETHTEGLEIRRYPEMLEALTIVRGLPWRAALGEGFHRLAGYVVGKNHRTPGRFRDPGEALPRMAPVVATERDGDVSVGFLMPEGRSVASLPTPADGRIHIVAVRPKRLAVLGFRGNFERERVAAKRRELLERVAHAGLASKGPVVFAGYDAPSTLPFLRRHEVWVEVAEGPANSPPETL
jgi:hypothetical protein